eukprot:GCRY01001320.1.p1 GENE.GCRY01001320.1~~GCRY01001320.1.p1  ORF type:complete len:2449 (-),score=910.40 GCRY01001320.1:765-8111(-)
MVLTLRIFAQNFNKELPLTFEDNEEVRNALPKVYETFGVDSAKGGFGLFLPLNDEGLGRWLSEFKDFSTHEIKNGDRLIFKQKIRPLRLKLSDETTKTALVDDSIPICEILETLAPKFMLGRPDVLSFKQITPSGREIWLDPLKTLPEQGISPTEMLILKTKYFFPGEEQLDYQNEIAVCLAYNQCLDSVVDGTYAVTRDIGAHLAALSCQVKFGNYTQSLHKKNVNLLDFLPAELAKSKGLDKEVQKEHEKLKDTSESGCRARYVRKCEALPTYGMTVFAVKNVNQTDKKKPGNHFLGIRGDKIFQLSEEKDIVAEFPLGDLNKWFGSATSFTFDFGDKFPEYKVLTEQGDEIDNLVTGYMQCKARAAAAQRVAGINLDQISGEGAGSADIVFLNEPTQELGPLVHNALLEANDKIKTGLQTLTEPFPKALAASDDREANAARANKLRDARVGVDRAVRALSEAVALLALKIVPTTSTKNFDLPAVVQALNNMAKGVADLAKSARTAYASCVASEVSSARDLVETGQTLVTMLESIVASTNHCLQGLAKGITPASIREKLLSLSAMTGDCSATCVSLSLNQTLSLQQQGAFTTAGQEIVGVAQEFADAVRQAAGRLTKPIDQDTLLFKAATLVFTAQALHAVIRALAHSVVHSTAAAILQEAMATLAKVLKDSIRACTNILNDDTVIKTVIGLEATIAAKMKTMDGQRDKHTKAYAAGSVAEMRRLVESIVQSTALLGNSSAKGNSAEIIAEIKTVGATVGTLLTLTRSVAAGEPDPILNHQLTQSIKLIAESTSNLVKVAGPLAKDPSSLELRQKLMHSITLLNSSLGKLLSDTTRKDAFVKLVAATHASIRTLGALISCSREAAPSNRSATSQATVDKCVTYVEENMDRVRDALTKLASSPQDAVFQTSLVSAAKAQIPPSTKLLQSVQSAAPHVTAPEAQKKYVLAAKDAAVALQNLSQAVKTASLACGSIELDLTIDYVGSIIEKVDNTRERVANANEKRIATSGRAEAAIPFDQAVDALAVADTLKSAVRSLAASTRVLLSASALSDSKEIGKSSKIVSKNLNSLHVEIEKMCATTSKAHLQQALLQAEQTTSKSLVSLLQVCKQAQVSSNEDAAVKQQLNTCSEDFSKSLVHLTHAIPAVKGLSDIGDDVRKMEKTLDTATLVKPEGASFKECAEKTNMQTRKLAENISDLISSTRKTPDELHAPAEAIAALLPELLTSIGNTASLAPHLSLQTELVLSGQHLVDSCATLLNDTSAVTANLKDLQAQQAMGTSAKNVSVALGDLLKTISRASPGIKHCDDALSLVAKAEQLFDTPTDVSTGTSYLAMVEVIHKAIGELDSTCKELDTTLKSNNPEQMGQAAQAIANSCFAVVTAASMAGALASGTPPGPRQGKYEMLFAEFDMAASAIDAVVEKGSARELVKAVQSTGKAAQAIEETARATASAEALPEVSRAFSTTADVLKIAVSALAEATKAFVPKMRGTNNEEERVRFDDSVNELRATVESLRSFVDAHLERHEPKPEEQALQDGINHAASTVSRAAKAILNLTRTAAEGKSGATATQRIPPAVRQISASAASLYASLKDALPGYETMNESERAIDVANSDLDTAQINATVGALAPAPGITLQASQEQLMAASRKLVQSVKRLKGANAQNLASCLAALSEPVQQLSENAVNAASCAEASQQDGFLGPPKTVVLSIALASAAARALAVCPSDTDAKGTLETETDNALTALESMLSELRVGVSVPSECDRLLVELGTSKARLDESAPLTGTSFLDAQRRVAVQATQLQQLSLGIAAEAKNVPVETLGDKAAELASSTTNIVAATRVLLGTLADPQVQQLLVGACKTACGGAEEVVTQIKNVASRPGDFETMQSLGTGCKALADNVIAFGNALQACATGERECEAAVQQLIDQAAELDTHAMFVEQELSPDNVTFDSYQKNLAALGEKLVQSAHAVGEAKGDQTQLGAAATQCAELVSATVEVTKNAATTIRDGSVRTQLYGAVKNVATRLSNLIQLAQRAMRNIGDQGLGANVTRAVADAAAAGEELTSTTQTVAESTTVGIKACGAVRDTLAELMASFPFTGDKAPTQSALPSDCVLAAKDVAQLVAKLIAASQAIQRELAQVVAKVPRTATELCTLLQAACTLSDDQGDVDRVLSSCRVLLQGLHDMVGAMAQAGHTLRSSEVQNQLTETSKKILADIRDVIAAAQQLSRLEDLAAQEAAKQLEQAARGIEETAKKLASLKLKPREAEGVDANALSFEEVMFNACQSLAQATGALVETTRAAQAELTADGQMSVEWNQMVIELAKSVADSTNKLAEYRSGEERDLISNANAVGAATLKLVEVVLPKEFEQGETIAQQKLRKASEAVQMAIQSLTDSAWQFIEEEEAIKEEEERKREEKATMANVSEEDKLRLQDQMRMLRLEKELEKARKKAQKLSQV